MFHSVSLLSQAPLVRRSHALLSVLFIEAIKARFDQPGYHVYRNAQDIVLKSCNGASCESELDFMCSFYKDDLCKDELLAQLPLLYSLLVECQACYQSYLLHTRRSFPVHLVPQKNEVNDYSGISFCCFYHFLTKSKAQKSQEVTHD